MILRQANSGAVIVGTAGQALIAQADGTWEPGQGGIPAGSFYFVTASNAGVVIAPDTDWTPIPVQVIPPANQSAFAQGAGSRYLISLVGNVKIEGDNPHLQIRPVINGVGINSAIIQCQEFGTAGTWRRCISAVLNMNVLDNNIPVGENLFGWEWKAGPTTTGTIAGPEAGEGLFVWNLYDIPFA
jgi:hypothetical protein